ncbi:MAG: dienelactone hydrolase family protein [Sneathiella sp.]|nr:dienelactone hydrolase family protein [Sneathiella sp.]
MVHLDGPRLATLSGRPAKTLVVMLHGYGADGHDLIDLGKIWQTSLVDATFVSPHAPEECELSPYGRQWFSLQQYDPDYMRRDPAQLAAAFEKFVGGARKAQAILENFIHKELVSLSLGWENVVLVGFSQGTMVGLFTSLRQKTAPAGVLGYSGALIGSNTLDEEITSRPPVTLLHGEEDDILPYPSLSLAEKGLKKAGIDVTTYSRPGLGHSIDMEGIKIGEIFLSSLF